MRRLTIALIATFALLAPTAAYAGNPAPIPSGGTVAVDLDDFQYPVSNGCYDQPGRITTTFPQSWSYYSADLTIKDSIGRVYGGVFEFESQAGVNNFTQLVCFNLDGPGTYYVTGNITFTRNSSEYEVPVSDVYVLTGPPAPVYVPSPAPPAPTGPSAKCVSAKKALKKARGTHKAAAIKRAKAKVKRVC